MKQMEKGSKNTVKTKVLTVMILLPHVSPGNSALRKEISAKSTRIYQFNGDKNKRKTPSLIMTVPKSFLPQIACRTKTTVF